MNRFDEPRADGAPPPWDGLVDDLARLRPASPSAACLARVAADLDVKTSRGVAVPRTRRLGWLAERLLWAAGGAMAASFVVGTALPWSSPSALPTLARGPGSADVSAPSMAVPVAETGDVDPAGTPAAESVAEESLAWSDDGVRYLADGFPARIYRHLVLERHADPSGRESLLPREDVFVVPVSLR